MKAKKTIIALGLLFVLAFFLRFYSLPSNLFIGPEQGRDLLVIRDLVMSHKLILIGPKTDVDGIFHGPLFYYLSSIPFFLSLGNPIFISGFLILIQSVTVFLVYIIGRDFFNKRTGYIAAILFTVSFGSIVYSRWLSNPPLSVPMGALFFYFLYKYIKGDRKYLLLVSIFFGITFQVEFINLPFLSIVMAIVLLKYWRIFLKERISVLILSLTLLLFTAFGTYLFFDIRHEFLITNSLMKLLNNPTQYFSFVSTVSHAIKMFIQFMSDFILPISFSVIPLVLLIVFVLWREKHKVLDASSFLILLWIFIPLLTLILLRHDVIQHFFLLSGIGLILGIAICLEKIMRAYFKLGLLIVFSLVGIHMYVWFSNIPNNKNIYFQTTQAELKYSDQERVIAWVYQEGKDESFDIQSYTIPYWSQQAWEYLFWYSGKEKNYFPTKEAKILYVIIQEDPSSQAFQDSWLNNTVSAWGEREKVATFGALRVEKLRTK